MPLPLPNLDPRRFDDLVAEMLALIPHYAPEWTNHNPSDPGIALIELLSWITEGMLYRTNRIPQATYLNFVSLLLGEHLDRPETLESERRRALGLFNEPYRAVTMEDFEREAEGAGAARARILSYPAEGRVVVVVVPTISTGVTPAIELLGKVKTELDKRKLVGTRVIVRGPIYTKVELEITVFPKSNTIHDELKEAVSEAVAAYLHPLSGGPEAAGWPFGRPLSIFELYHLIESIPGVDYTKRIIMKENGAIVEKEIKVQDLPLLESLAVEVVI